MSLGFGEDGKVDAPDAPFRAQFHLDSPCTFLCRRFSRCFFLLSYVYAGAGVVWDCYVNVTVTDADTKVKGACELPAVGAGNRTLVP